MIARMWNKEFNDNMVVGIATALMLVVHMARAEYFYPGLSNETGGMESRTDKSSTIILAVRNPRLNKSDIGLAVPWREHFQRYIVTKPLF